MRSLVLAIGFLLLAPTAGAESPHAPRYDRVRFSVERNAHVENDRVSAQLVTEREGSDPVGLADEVNQAMEWALAKVRDADAVEGRTENYQTFPRHVKEDERVWVVSQELLLESSDVDALRVLLGELQARLQLRGMGFFPSDARRREAEEAVTLEALAAFRARAERVREALGFAGWRLVELSIGAGGEPPPQPRYGRTMMAEAAMAAPPALEAGESEVSITLHATIELQN